MTTLVAGASGATGKHLVTQLLKMGQKVKVIVRSSSNIPDAWIGNEAVQIIKANISEMSLPEMSMHLKDCEGVACCLGHNMSFKGIYGKPRNLVTGAVQLLCGAIKENEQQRTVRFVLMNTAGNMNRNLDEQISFGERLVIGSLRLLLPPHPDNEKAADYLRLSIGQKDTSIEWVVVRPDTLIDEGNVSEYELFASPTRSAIFNPGKTSRVNVGNFMARLLVENDLWNEWKGQMPVIYNEVDAGK